MLGLLVWPQELWWLWALALGASQSTVFALALALPVDLLDPGRGAATLSLMLTIGYAGILGGPLIIGVLRDATNSFTLAWLFTLGIGVVMLLLALALPETGGGLRGTAPH
jgi:CP family cyanate transporter-like MFS transporter